MRIERILRMKFLVSELKNNNYPNAERMIKLFKSMEWDNKEAFNCSTRTIYRDIETLKEKFGAPVHYDESLKGYYLSDNEWFFDMPELEKLNVANKVIANKLSADISPKGMAAELKSDNADIMSKSQELFKQQTINNFFSADTVVVNIDTAVMDTIYTAWKNSQLVLIHYKKVNEPEEQRLIEPHSITCADRIWYVKGHCHQRNEDRIFALHRISSALLQDRFFKPKLDKGSDRRREHFFVYEKVAGARLWCSESIAGYIEEQAETRDIKISYNGDGSIEIKLPELNENDLIRWIVGMGHTVKVLAPDTLRRKVIIFLEKALTLYK